MARNEITTPLDLSNLENHNKNYEELYDQIDATDKRLSENMWEEIKDANTIKMLEPVETKTDLPAEANDKSLITVIDEQRVYAHVHDEWQPFSEIDLDPFSPFKDELASIISEYEKKIDDLTTEVIETKDSAIESIKSIQSQSESNIKETEQNAVNSINKAHEETDNHMSEVEQDLKDKTEEFTTKFNDYISKLADSTNTSLDDIERAKQEALSALENENIDNMQKYKLTDDSGAHQTISLNNDTEKLHALEPGYHYTTSTPIDLPATSTAGFTTVQTRSDYDNLKHIIFRPYNSTQMFLKRYYNEWLDWEPMDGTKVELFSGSFSDASGQITLNDDPRKYSYLKVDMNHIGGNDTLFASFASNHAILRPFNLGNSANGATLMELDLNLESSDPTKMGVTHSIRVESDTATGKDYMPEIRRIEGVK